MTTQQTKTTYRTALEDVEISTDVADAIAQMQASGRDTGTLTHETRAGYVTALCRALRLNPLTNPVQFIRLNGKEVLYVTRTATDQLAAMHGLNRRTIDGPKITDIAGVKVAICVVEVSLPNGRSETATATLPVADPANLYMKLETKAKRRGTLAILGLGLLAEDEIETIPGAQRMTPVDLPAAPADPPASSVAPSPGYVAQISDDEIARLGIEHRGDVAPVESDAQLPPALDAFFARVAEIELPGEAVAVWLKHRTDLATLPAADRTTAWDALCKRTGEVGKMKASGARTWLTKAVKEEEARRASVEPSNGGAA